MSILDILYRGESKDAYNSILDTYKKNGSCTVNFVYFANIMKRRLLEGNICELPADTKKSKIYENSLRNGDFLFPDGIALQVYYWIEKHFRLSNLNGTDFIPYFFDRLSDMENNSIGLYFFQCYDPAIGKSVESLSKGIQAIKKRFPHIEIIGSSQVLYNQRESFSEGEIIRQKLIDSSHDVKVFFNCTGSPFQEIFVQNYQDVFQNCIVFNAGGTIDYLTGQEKRAPDRVVKARVLETFRRIYTYPEKNLSKFMEMFGILRIRKRKMTRLGQNLLQKNSG